MLHAVFFDDLVRSLTDLGSWRIAKTLISCFFYADDIAIIADDPNHLQLMLAACDEYAASRDTLAHRPSAISSLTQTSANYHSMVTELTRSQFFVYLGVTFDHKRNNNRLNVDRLVVKTVHSELITDV